MSHFRGLLIPKETIRACITSNLAPRLLTALAMLKCSVVPYSLLKSANEKPLLLLLNGRA